MGKSPNKKFSFTGGPGTGKTTVLNALTTRGYHCMADEARAIIRTRLESGLTPRPEPAVFAQNIFEMDVANYCNAPPNDVCFFDRGVVDSLGMLYSSGLISDDDIELQLSKHPYNHIVFLFPPWKEIYRTDDERDQSWDESVQVYKAVKIWYSRCNYQTKEVPIGTVNERIAFIEDAIKEGQLSSNPY